VTRRFGILAGCALVLASAPTRAADPARWDEVPAEDLARTVAVVEPADAEGVFWRTWLEDDLARGGANARIDHYVRIKILTANGAQRHSTMSFPYFRHSKITDLSARTIQPDGTIVPLSADAVITETMLRVGREELRRKSFAMPGVVPGAIVEYRFREHRKGAMGGYLSYDLQHEIPYRKISFFSRDPIPGVELRREPRNTAVEHARAGGWNEVFVTNVPAFVAEPFMPPARHVRGWLLVYFAPRTYGPAWQYWKEYGARQLDWFEPWTRPDEGSQQLARWIVGRGTTPDSAAARLLRWMWRDMRWVHGTRRESLEVSGYESRTRVADALRDRKALWGEANYVFACLARSARLDVRLAYVGSRHWPSFSPELRNSDLLPFELVAIRDGPGWIFADAHQRYLPPHRLEWDEEAQPVLVCDRDTSQLLVTPMASHEATVLERHAVLDLAEDGTLSGELRLTFGGHWNQILREAMGDAAQAPLDSLVQERTSWQGEGFEITDLRVRPGGDERDPLVLMGKITLPGYATLTAKRLLLQPAALSARASSAFATSARRHPVAYSFPWSERDSVVVRLPRGWSAEALPRLEPALAAGIAAHRAETSLAPDGSHLVYTRRLDTGIDRVLRFPRERYDELRKWNQLVAERDRATVTFVRAGEP
jgi:hypothetical protein